MVAKKASGTTAKAVPAVSKAAAKPKAATTKLTTAAVSALFAHQKKMQKIQKDAEGNAKRAIKKHAPAFRISKRPCRKSETKPIGNI